MTQVGLCVVLTSRHGASRRTATGTDRRSSSSALGCSCQPTTRNVGKPLETPAERLRRGPRQIGEPLSVRWQQVTRIGIQRLHGMGSAGRRRHLSTARDVQHEAHTPVAASADLTGTRLRNSRRGAVRYWGPERNGSPVVTSRLHDAFKRTLDDPKVIDTFDKFEQPVIYMDTAEYSRYMRDDFVRQKAIVERLGLLLKT